MTSRRWSLLLCVPLCLAAGSAPLKYRPKVGEIHRAHIVYDMRVGENRAKLELDATDRVLAVAANGNVSIEETQTNTVLIAGGKKAAQPSAQPSIDIFRSDNTLVPKAVATDDSKEDLRTQNLHAVKLPGFSLAVGKTWTWRTKSDDSTGQTSMLARYKVLGSEKVAGAACWKISVVSKELAGKAPASATGEVWMLKSDGFTLQEKFTFKNFPGPGGGGTVDGTVSVTPIH